EPPVFDADLAARAQNPELFEHYDELVAQRQSFSDQLRRLTNPPDEDVTAANDVLASVKTKYDAHLADANRYSGGPEARRLRAQIRSAEADLKELMDRRAAFEADEATLSPETLAAQQQFQAVDYQLRDLGREVAAARLRAAEMTGLGSVEPTPLPAERVTEPPPSTTIEPARQEA